MRALLLAAGFGTRLRPLTDLLPKCLVPIHGRPLLDYWLELLINNGVDEVLINTHYLAPMVVEFLEKSSWMDNVTIVYEEKLLGTGGTVLKNSSFFKNEPFIVAHADNLTIFDVQDFIKNHRNRPSGTEMTMMVFKTDDPQSCGVVDINKNGVVHAFYEKVSSPPGNLANAAVYIFEPSMFDCLDNLMKMEIDLSTEILPHMMGRIFAYRNSSYHQDIGTIDSWIEANQDFPAKPANKQNKEAWLKVYDTENENISTVVAKLLPMVSE